MSDLDYKAKAAELWNKFDANNRASVRFGMFPFDTMKAAEAEGYKSQPLCVALMDYAESCDNMREVHRKNADKIDGFDRDDLGESPDY